MDEKDVFVDIFLKNSLPKITFQQQKQYQAMRTNLKVKPLMLNTQRKSRKKPSSKKPRMPKVKCIKPSVTCKNYDAYEKLRVLWKEYMSELLHSYFVASNKGTTLHLDTKQAQDVLLKADFHGAVLTVANSPCKNHIDVTGTVIQETKNIFVLCTKQNKILKIPKKHTTFILNYPEGFRTYIFGNQFCLRPSHRLTKKFRNYASLLELL